MSAIHFIQSGRNIIVGVVRDDVMTLAAGIAFYSALSFAPILILLVTTTAALDSDLQQGLIDEINKLMGEQASESIDSIIDYARERKSGRTFAGIAGIGMLIFSATAVFAQLQSALNRVWDVKPKPGRGIWSWLRKRILSAGMIIALMFLLLVSLAVDAILSMLMDPGETLAGQALNTVVSFLVFATIFGVMFWYLPDVKIHWKDVGIGSLITAMLFIIGKYLIGLYLGHSTLASAYGAAGSLLVLLLWVYYSALIFLFGAELTQEVASASGRGIQPDKHAVAIERVEVAEGEKTSKATERDDTSSRQN